MNIETHQPNVQFAYDITFEQASQYFELPLDTAANRFDLSSSHFKRVCRRIGILRWPFRQLSKIKSQINELDEQEHTESIKEYKQTQLHQQRLNAVQQSISFPLKQKHLKHLYLVLKIPENIKLQTPGPSTLSSHNHHRISKRYPLAESNQKRKSKSIGRRPNSFRTDTLYKVSLPFLLNYDELAYNCHPQRQSSQIC
eukprot:gb/GECH01001131.1/.p1 GENE.gb/GECH01001131.1/~~gb/GECH01001131.1/.p1  ORF type:complete len:198 (+),score=31.00 gb/GECH01001131.1/:1-594(+)